MKNNIHQRISKEITDLRSEVHSVALHSPEEVPTTMENVQGFITLTHRDPLESRVQGVMDTIKGRLRIASKIDSCKKNAHNATQKNADLKKEKVDTTIERTCLNTKREALQFSPLQRIMIRCLFPVALVAGFADAAFLFPVLRHGGYPLFAALGVSAFVALFISVGHVGFVPWIHAREGKVQLKRMCIVLISALLFFLLIAVIRTAAITSVVNIDVSEAVPSTASALSSYSISLISFFIFCFVLLAAQFVYHLPHADEYSSLSKQIRILTKQIKAIAAAQSTLEQAILTEEVATKDELEFAILSLNQCESIAHEGVSIYRKSFVRLHRTVPACFREPITFSFNKGLDLHPEKNV